MILSAMRFFAFVLCRASTETMTDTPWQSTVMITTSLSIPAPLKFVTVRTKTATPSSTMVLKILMEMVLTFAGLATPSRLTVTMMTTRSTLGVPNSATELITTVTESRTNKSLLNRVRRSVETVNNDVRAAIGSVPLRKPVTV